MDLGLHDKRVLVTGASRGIGRAIAAAFLDEGARVAICARGEEALASTAAELGGRGDVHWRTVDIGRPGDPTAFVEWGADALGGVDIVVSNASAMAPDWPSLCAVDLVGTEELIRAGLARMDDDAGANVVCIGSRGASTAAPRIAAYAAAKAATISMVKSMSREVARRGIRVNAVSPGDVIFPGGVWDRAREEGGKLWDAIVRENPFRRLGRPEEIADVVVFVASPRASFMTGANVLVDGGATNGLQI